MTPHELIVAAGVAIAAASWLAGSLAPWWRVLEWAHRDYLDDIYDEGYDDATRHLRSVEPAPQGQDADVRRVQGFLPRVPAEPPPTTSQDLCEGTGLALEGGRVGDWRADYAEQLAPAVLDAENLPGPDSTPAPRAGEHHYEEFPLPAILHLGAEYDGGDQTFARVQLRQMTAINRHEAARKALLDECGVPWVPMEMIAA